MEVDMDDVGLYQVRARGRLTIDDVERAAGTITTDEIGRATMHGVQLERVDITEKGVVALVSATRTGAERLRSALNGDNEEALQVDAVDAAALHAREPLTP